MSKYVKISALGFNNLYETDTGKSVESYVRDVIDFIDTQLENVLPDKPDLIVLPECCDRIIKPHASMHFNSDRIMEYYQARGDRVRDHLMSVAKAHRCNIAYSAHRFLPDGSRRNATQFINRDGGIDGIYHKNHLVVGEFDKGGIFYGKDAVPIKTDFGSVGGVICFDLNFDELRQKYVDNRPDVLVFSSAYHGGLMQRYWAYSCRSYFVGAVTNSTCTIISPVGDIVATSTNYYNYVTASVNLDCAVVHLDGNRMSKLTGAKQKYGSKFNIYDPGFLGSVLISCESDDMTIRDIIQEFEIELLDDYMKRSLAHRHEPGHIENT